MEPTLCGMRRTALVRDLTAVLVAFLLVACTAPGRDRPEPPLPVSLGDCAGPAPGPDPDFATALAVPGEWVRVEAGTSPRTTEATARAIERALDRGATVHAHTDARTGEVAYAIAQHGGQHVFVGDCATALFTEPLRRKYGAGYDRVVGGLIGQPPGFVARALQGDPEYAVYLLGDRYARRDVPPGLAVLQGEGLLRTPDVSSWSRDVRLCAVATVGVGGCVGRRPEVDVSQVGLTYDPLDPVVEVALYRDAPFGLVAVLARVDVVAEARKAGFDPATDGLQLLVRPASSPTLAEVLADPSLALRALEVVRVAPCRQAICR